MIDTKSLLANNLDAYLNFLYEGLTGYMAIAELKRTPNKNYMQHHFYMWPDQRLDIRNHINERSGTVETFLTPALFSASVATKEYFKCSNVAWLDIDGNPNFGGHKPTLRIQSGNANHEHWYYRMVSPIESIIELERINKCLAYTLGADKGWNGNRLLRPIGTPNHKYDHRPIVRVLNVFDVEYPKGHLDEGWTDPTELNGKVHLSETPLVIPDLTETLLKYPWSDNASELLRWSECPPHKRSESLMALGYHMAEMGMSHAEMLAVLLHADDKWGKFKNRPDRMKRIGEIIVRAKDKHPGALTVDTGPLSVLDDLINRGFIGGWNSIGEVEVDFDWIVENFLLTGTNLILAGKQDVGKTQLSLRFGINMALGNDDFIEHKIVKQQKILFLSLELGIVPIRLLRDKMSNDITPEERDILEEQFIIAPIGEAMNLYTAGGQEQLLKLLDMFRPDGVIIDSIGKTISSPSNEEQALAMTNFLNRLNKKGLFFWGIHHLRKLEGGGRERPPSLDDVYGNQYVTAFARSAYGLYTMGGDLRFKQLKNNFAKKPDNVQILQRTPFLNFSVQGELSESEETQQSGKSNASKLFGEK